jgi:hypothetical protein
MHGNSSGQTAMDAGAGSPALGLKNGKTQKTKSEILRFNYPVYKMLDYLNIMGLF